MKVDARGSTVLGEDREPNATSPASQQRAASDTGARSTAPRSPYVIPVNFRMVGGGIVIRLGTGWAAYHLDDEAVTFEADQSRRPGALAGVLWSKESPVPSPTTMWHGLEPTSPNPIVKVPGVRVFEIVPFKVSGRSVEPDLRGEQADLAAGPWSRGR